jgi:hypothetical protein
MISAAAQDAFYESKRSPALPLAVNDVVTVRGGANAWVISLEQEAPEAKYLIEYEDGSDEVLPLSSLERR